MVHCGTLIWSVFLSEDFCCRLFFPEQDTFSKAVQLHFLQTTCRTWNMFVIHGHIFISISLSQKVWIQFHLHNKKLNNYDAHIFSLNSTVINYAKMVQHIIKYGWACLTCKLLSVKSEIIKCYIKRKEKIWPDSVSTCIIQGVLVNNLTDCKITSVINNYCKMVQLSKSN